MRKYIYIALLLFGFMGFAQSPLVLASQQQATPTCTADPNELNTTANPTSDFYCNEGTDLSAWLQFGSVTRLLESTDTDTGDYALAIRSDDGGTGFAYLPISVTSGDTFDITFKTKEKVGTNANFFISGVGITNNGSQNLDTPATEVTFSTEATGTGTMQLRFHPARSNGAGDPNDILLIYYVKVVKTN